MGWLAPVTSKPWPLVEKFLQSLPQGTLLADVGCGNGKYLHVNPSCYPIGSDRSV
jgi:tRNA (uracil-5-)-methyltransferase TRM9